MEATGGEGAGTARRYFSMVGFFEKKMERGAFMVTFAAKGSRLLKPSFCMYKRLDTACRQIHHAGTILTDSL